MINLLSESAYVAQTNKIKTAITNKVNSMKVAFTRIGAKLGATINWLDDVESTLDDELTAINTELTDKGSTQADDFSEVAEKISEIQTGITPTGTISITQNGTYDVTDYASASVAVADSEFVGLVEGTYGKLYNEDVTTVGSKIFQSNPYITSVNFPNSVITGSTAFYDCVNLISASFASATTISDYSFRACTELKNTYFPDVTSVSSYAFQQASVLEILDLPKCATINAAAFVNCSQLKTLILRRDNVCTLMSNTAFNGTPFRNSVGGTVYVPQALVLTYQSATNWSALESTTFLPIEGSIYE